MWFQVFDKIAMLVSKITLRKVQKKQNNKKHKIAGRYWVKRAGIFLGGGVRLSESAGMREQRSEAQRVL